MALYAQIKRLVVSQGDESFWPGEVDGKLTAQIINEIKNVIGLWAKEHEIEAQLKKKGTSGERYSYFDGKVQAFSQIWEMVVFDGRSVPDGTVSPQEYNGANKEWSRKVHESKTQEIRLRS